MVDLALLQSVSYIAGALGLCVAAIYYVMNIRETSKNRRATLTTNLVQNLAQQDSIRTWFKVLIETRWKDLDDFKSKYDSRVNPENFIQRVDIWTKCELVGYQFRSGLIDIDTVYALFGDFMINTWAMYRPIIEYYRKNGDFSDDYLVNYEYLAKALTKMKSERAPNSMALTPFGKDKLEVVLKS